MGRAVTLVAFLVAGLFLPSRAAAQITKIVDNGNDAQRLVFAVMGDGYTALDQTKFVADVNKLIVTGVLGHDLYAVRSRAYNVYRIDVVSSVSGVSTVSRNTALHTVYNGRQSDCWITEATDTQSLVIQQAASLPKVDFYVVIPNTSEYGGCSSNNILYITAGSPYNVASHEYGHGIGYLYDEYGAGDGTANPDMRDDLNCSSGTRRAAINWSSKIPLTRPIPTAFTYGMNDNTDVGAFVGCDRYDTGIFRPVQMCRMNDIYHFFCPVCQDVMNRALGAHIVSPPQAPAGLRIIQQQERAQLSSPSGKSLSRLAGGPLPILALLGGQPAPAAPSYVSLVLQVSNTNIRILKASEGRGVLPNANAVSDSLYEVTQNNTVIAAGGLPPGWQSQHSYGPAGGGGAAHSSRPARSTTVSVLIPNATLRGLLSGGTTLSLNKVKPGVRLEPITPASVTALKAKNQLTSRASMTATEFVTQLQPQVPPANRGR